MATSEHDQRREPQRDDHASRRQFMRKAVYLAPALLTLPTALSAAQAGSGEGQGVCVFPPEGGEGTIVGGPFDGDICS